MNALPALVERHLERALTGDDAVPVHVRLSQEGEMRQKPDSRPMTFTATEVLEVGRVAFSWRARFPIVGPIALNVLDAYDAGRGLLEVRMLGFRLARRQSSELARGEALRYLAELVWAPHAIAHNKELEWRELGPHSVEVATHVGDERLGVALTFDADGDIVRSFSDLRRRQVDSEWIPTPWGGEFSDYRELGGVRIPAAAEVYWELDEGRFVYWRGRITDFEVAL